MIGNLERNFPLFVNLFIKTVQGGFGGKKSGSRPVRIRIPVVIHTDIHLCLFAHGFYRIVANPETSGIVADIGALLFAPPVKRTVHLIA